MSRAAIRRIVGYTFDELASDPAEWMRRADGLRLAAKACLAADVPLTITMMLQGLSLELLSKAVLVASGTAAPEIHGLNKLIQDHACVPLSPDEASVMVYLSECVIWQGKYPTPKNPENFDKFQDDCLEALTSRSSNGTNHYIRLNPARDPREIQVVWSRLVAEYRRRQTAAGR